MKRPKLKRFRLAIYNPCDESEPIEFIGPVFLDCPFDRLTMRLTIEHFNRQFWRELDYCVAIYPWSERRKVGAA